MQFLLENFCQKPLLSKAFLAFFSAKVITSSFVASSFAKFTAKESTYSFTGSIHFDFTSFNFNFFAKEEEDYKAIIIIIIESIKVVKAAVAIMVIAPPKLARLLQYS